MEPNFIYNDLDCDLYAAVLMQVEPSVIVTSSKADDEMQKVLNEYSMLFSIVFNLRSTA